MTMAMTITLNNLLGRVKKNNPSANLELIKKAYDFADGAHQGQKRMSGADYINHPLATAYHLAKMKLNSTTIAAALLHDVVDDTPLSNEDIKREFGREIAFLVENISKLGKIKYRGVGRQVENLRKLFLAMAKDIRVILIKLCDRADNLKSLNYLPENKQRRIAQESLEIYAPLANRLGMGELKGQLEDLAFYYVYPKECQELKESVKEKYQQRQEYLRRIKPIIEKELKKENIKPIEIQFRAKHYYSLYKKLKRYDNDLNKIYDLVALRIIVGNIEDCYKTLGILHKLWRPLPGRIKDYIALPKPNGYQSLHTTVFCIQGEIVEFQIKTPEMHQKAEFGIAAHWYYSEQKGLKAYLKRKIIKPPEDKLNWIKQLTQWQEETKGILPEKYLESLKIDFFNNRIFVFTPKGDVIDLPEGATPIDFAYAIHTEIGNRCNGAKINGKLESLSSKLHNGDLIEIMIDKNKKPSSDWLKLVKTNLARSHIRKVLEKYQQELPKKELKPIQKEPSLSRPPLIKKPLLKTEVASSKIILAGQSGLFYRLAQCCSPQPGDKIKAYITKNKGASIHQINCPNFQNLKRKWPQRIIDACWEKKND
ncbi:MAG: hypothetical protein CO144_00335 [Candidatus Nealsonbacteria bacterium CG_4_9_14_3_um_filter_35_11]|uniref:(P)ppGpp synthetase n=2 Tax=Candidatus Nealsoniibacteriota TaxID=1817911 RepID=A0A2M7DBH1_9BACT|nr:MAG: hypothetical protein COV62_02540 [Candidatus Nealsonbacteria bacterium CG11_big_fil_rev_8_21_14_0_20_35_11]PIV45822.1 MAG: hypothetical protein COS24_00265 [Candidatus Nealsonbacteria bacterium CG02_land_8_20_14_3_00_34_20]PIZ89854.1 MAG: hypothetical protein COX88_01590 [Candidatus Nealsonbacteria bacterium CG_4_10_14_0_2_um_filter_35_20]PJA84824.1 MAG: hypothetical protein CO144_00335 [Candidatus Nealsonbacteria bacterium CG_4_9_14_3_um_filter_35_11]